MRDDISSSLPHSLPVNTGRPLFEKGADPLGKILGRRTSGEGLRSSSCASKASPNVACNSALAPGIGVRRARSASCAARAVASPASVFLAGTTRLTSPSASAGAVSEAIAEQHQLSDRASARRCAGCVAGSSRHRGWSMDVARGKYWVVRREGQSRRQHEAEPDPVAAPDGGDAGSAYTAFPSAMGGARRQSGKAPSAVLACDDQFGEHLGDVANHSAQKRGARRRAGTTRAARSSTPRDRLGHIPHSDQ